MTPSRSCHQDRNASYPLRQRAIRTARISGRTCGDRTHDQRITYHYSFRYLRKQFVVWTISSPCTDVFRWAPYSLYTFNAFLRSLARDCRGDFADEFPEFDA